MIFLHFSLASENNVVITLNTPHHSQYAQQPAVLADLYGLEEPYEMASLNNRLFRMSDFLKGNSLDLHGLSNMSFLYKSLRIPFELNIL